MEALTLPIGMDDIRFSIRVPFRAQLVKPVNEQQNERYKQHAFPCGHRGLIEPIVVFVRREVLSMCLRIPLIIRVRVQALVRSLCGHFHFYTTIKLSGMCVGRTRTAAGGMRLVVWEVGTRYVFCWRTCTATSTLVTNPNAATTGSCSKGGTPTE